MRRNQRREHTNQRQIRTMGNNTSRETFTFFRYVVAIYFCERCGSQHGVTSKQFADVLSFELLEMIHFSGAETPCALAWDASNSVAEWDHS
jgi:hypothetical protein